MAKLSVIREKFLGSTIGYVRDIGLMFGDRTLEMNNLEDFHGTLVRDSMLCNLKNWIQLWHYPLKYLYQIDSCH